MNFHSRSFVRQNETHFCVDGKVVNGPFPDGGSQKRPRLPYEHIFGVFDNEDVAGQLPSAEPECWSHVRETSVERFKMPENPQFIH